MKTEIDLAKLDEAIRALPTVTRMVREHNPRPNVPPGVENKNYEHNEESIAAIEQLIRSLRLTTDYDNR